MLRSARHFRTGTQVVVVAQAWDTPRNRREFTEHLAAARREGVKVRWFHDQLSQQALVQMLSRADVFACPSGTNRSAS
ncbi:hypothetical protein ACQP2C_12000 [Micromonospora zamorensis]|uniref:hypothetical protein n=1 Tax=Micromonospora zamorensis TaxID=709883 RepID=UPI003D954D64